ncbi:MAG: amino acid ABC transporter permease [Ilumatobacteraceae bacterium]
MPGTRRAAFDRRQRRRSALVAGVSTIVAVAALIVLVPLAPGWDKVRESFFDVDEFRSALPQLWRPFLLNLRVFVICTPLIMIVGMLVALARNVRSPALYPLRLFATIYTDVVRGVPVILWISLIGLGVPGLFQERAWYSKGIVWGSVALVMCYSAYVAEVFRAGIIGIHESQRAAARSLGLSTGQTMRSVILPQAVRRVVPPLMNDVVSLQKDVALLSVIGAVEALRRANVIVAKTFDFTALVAAAVLFLCVSIPLTRLADHLLVRQIRRSSGTAVR